MLQTKNFIKRSFPKSQKDADNQRINNVFEHLMKHYDKEITLDEVAEIANMTPNAFCRFFNFVPEKLSPIS